MKILCGLLISAAAWGQAFEVATVRPHVFQGQGGGRLGVSISGNRVTVSIVTLSRLIQAAYGVKDYQVSGGPSWMAASDTTFDIAAKAEGDAAPSAEQVNVMLQKLLAERFQLKFHRETKELPVYELVVAKGGPKLKESAPGSRGGAGLGRGNMRMSNTPISRFAQGLNSVADRPVIDKTGLTGNYDIQIEWAAEGSQDPGPSLFTAVQEQLGLKLEPAKSSTEVLVIDHAEKPSDN